MRILAIALLAAFALGCDSEPQSEDSESSAVRSFKR